MRMAGRTISQVFRLALLAIAVPLSAQQKVPPLEEILRQLETNLDQYDARVPSLFCDEHVVSQVFPGMRNQNTVTDSVFRLKRMAAAGNTTTLDESREIKTVNGRPAKSQELGGPSVLSGIFEGALSVVTMSQSVCMNYTLERPRGNDPLAPYVIRFASVITPQNSAKCLLEEDSKGRILIDRATLEVMRLELTTPHHTIIPGGAYSGPVKGEWVLSVDYAPVPLGGQSFWLPAAVTSRETSGGGTFHKIVWTFRATYRNFHKLEVTSRIVPAEGTAGK